MKKRNKKTEKTKKRHAVNKKTVYGSIFAVAMLILALVFFVIRPELKRVFEKKNSLEEQKLQIELIKESASKAGEYSKLIEEFGGEASLIDAAVVTKDEVVHFIESIEGIAKETVTSVEITPQAAPKKKKKATLNLPGSVGDEKKKEEEAQEALERSKVRLLVTVKGDYKQFLKFFYKLENMAQVFDINSVSVSKPSTTAGISREEKNLSGQVVASMVISFLPREK